MRGQRSEKENITYQIIKIKELINKKKYNLAWKAINDLLPDYYDDPKLKFQIICLKMIEGSYEEALALLEDLIDDRNFIMQTELYVMLGLEEKEYEMYNKYFKEFMLDDPFYIKDVRYRILYIYLNKKYNFNFVMPEFLGSNYLESQIYDYDKELALENIKLNHLDLLEVCKGKFSDSVNVDEFFDYALDYINNSNDRGVLKYGRLVYKFYYPNCGTIKTGDLVDGICVVTSLSDKNIIAMYPIDISESNKVIGYNNTNTNNLCKRKIKTKNGLDRFNEKYNN